MPLASGTRTTPLGWLGLARLGSSYLRLYAALGRIRGSEQRFVWFLGFRLFEENPKKIAATALALTTVPTKLVSLPIQLALWCST
jgi:hypothetical protein